MQFLVLGYDGKDSDAPSRRQAVRQQHIELGNKLMAEGKIVSVILGFLANLGNTTKKSLS